MKVWRTVWKIAFNKHLWVPYSVANIVSGEWDMVPAPKVFIGKMKKLPCKYINNNILW